MLLCFVPGCGNTILHACEVLETPKKESVFSVYYMPEKWHKKMHFSQNLLRENAHYSF